MDDVSHGSMFGALASALDDPWTKTARPEQLPPPGDWSIWLYIGGRGTGKTRTGAEWVRSKIESGRVGRVALIGPTAADVRDTMIEGESGLLAICPDHNRPVYESSKRRVIWPNGAFAMMYSSEEPDRLRGPQHGAIWADELGAWSNLQATWDMSMFGLRLCARPQCMISTTPKPVKLLKELIARDGQDVAVTRGTTYDNRENLPPSFFSQIVRRYEGTRLGRQELNAELLDDVPGALWTRDTIDRARSKVAAPSMKRVVVGVDPSGTRGADDGGDSVGIVVCGLGVDGRGYVLADRTCKLSPAGWGRKVVDAYREFSADRVVAEKNFGGAMVEHVIRTADSSVSFKDVTASRGKIVRAEPVAALYEQGRISHIGVLDDLEDQMAAMGSDGYAGAGSPDRVDALVWALSELMTGPSNTMTIMPFWDVFRGVA